MHRAIPSGSKILTRKWREKEIDIHYQHLQKIKGSVDSSCPPSYTHLKRKAKRQKIIQGNFHTDRNFQIQRLNQILIDKMQGILKKDFNNTMPFQKSSLNSSVRRKKLKQITKQNQALLKRLQYKQPVYKIFQWEKDRKINQKRLQLMCEFPYQLGVTQEKKFKGVLDGRRRNTSRDQSANGSQMNKTHKKLSPINFNTRAPSYKKGLHINERYFIVEMYKQRFKVLIVCSDVERPDTFNLELDWQDAEELMGGKEDFGALAKMLVLEQGELALVDPKAVSRKKIEPPVFEMNIEEEPRENQQFQVQK